MVQSHLSWVIFCNVNLHSNTDSLQYYLKMSPWRSTLGFRHFRHLLTMNKLCNLSLTVLPHMFLNLFSMLRSLCSLFCFLCHFRVVFTTGSPPTCLPSSYDIVIGINSTINEVLTTLMCSDVNGGVISYTIDATSGKCSTLVTNI